jgi:hypothetical protein
MLQPPSAQLGHGNDGVIQAPVRTQSRLPLATLEAISSPGASKALDLHSTGFIPRNGGAFGPMRITDFLCNCLVASVFDVVSR